MSVTPNNRGIRIGTGRGAGPAKINDPKEEFLAQIINRLNELFIMDKLSDSDLLSFVRSVVDKVCENGKAMALLKRNTRERARPGGVPRAVEVAVIGSNEAHRNLMMQLLENPSKSRSFPHVIYDFIEGDAARTSLHR